MNITKYILISAVCVTLGAKAQPISIPGSQFPVVQHMSNYFRFIGVDTNGGRSVFSNTRSNFTAPWDVLTSDMGVALQANGTVPFVSLASFGAVGDGVTDDTTAVQDWANYICSTNCLGLVPPAANEYKITSEIDFTNTARIVPGGSGTVFAGSAFSPTHCRFNQHTAGANGWVFNNYDDNITVDGIFITNSASANYLNIDSSGFLFTGSVGSHDSRFTQIGAANFGRGIFTVDLASSMFTSIACQNNLIGFETTNILNTGNYPMTIQSSIFSGNYQTQIKASGTNQPVLVEGCIITPTVAGSYAVTSFSRNLTLLNDQFLPIGGTNLINQTGGNLLMLNCTSLVNGGNTYWPIHGTNCNITIFGTLDYSNSVDGSSVFLFGSNSKLRAFPDEQFTKNDGSGNLTTNISTLATANGNIPGVISSLFVPPTGNDGTVWNSNKVSYWVTATKTNLISDGR